MRSCILLPALVALMVSCDAPRFTVGTHLRETTLAEIGGHLADVVERETGWNVQALAGPEYNVMANVDLVRRGEVDFALTGEALPVEQIPGVRTVLPLYPEFLVILHDQSLGDAASLDELVRGRRVGVGPEGHPHSAAMLRLIGDLGVTTDAFTPVYTPLDRMRVDSGEMDVLLTFAGADRQRIEDQIKSGARLFSLDDFRLDGSGSRVDGYLMKRPYFQSFIIPKNAFHRQPEEPVLTLAATVILVTRSDMPDDVVYAVVSAIFDNASYLSRKNPVFGALSQRFDEAKVTFPLHEGTRQYLNRDKPTFLERYAEVLALLVSIVVVAFGGIRWINRILTKTKKDRIDVHYRAVQDIVGREIGSEEDARSAIRELLDLRSRAVEQLRTEKLAADESFTIFLHLVHETIRRFEDSRR